MFAIIGLLNTGVVAQLVRAPACHAGGRGFESRPFRTLTKVYQYGILFCYINRIINNQILIIMTKNQLRMNVFVKTIIGRVIAALEWSILLSLMAFTISYLLLPIITAVDYHEGQVPSFTYNGLTFVCGFLGLLIGLNLKASLIIWWIWPMNKKVARKFIASQKQELEKKISNRDELIKDIEKKYHNQVLIIDEEIEQNKSKLQELTLLENSL